MRVDFDLDRLPPDVRIHPLRFDYDAEGVCWQLELCPNKAHHNDVITIWADSLGAFSDLATAILAAVAEAGAKPVPAIPAQEEDS